MSGKLRNEKIQKFIESHFLLDKIKKYVEDVYTSRKSASLSAEQQIDFSTLGNCEYFYRFLYYRYEELFFEEWRDKCRQQFSADNTRAIKLAPSGFSKGLRDLLISEPPTSAVSFYLNVLFSLFAAQDSDGNRFIFDTNGKLQDQDSSFFDQEILKASIVDYSDPLNKIKFFQWALGQIYPENINYDTDNSFALHVRNPDWLTIYTMFISVVNGNDYAACRRKAWKAALAPNVSLATQIMPDTVNENNVTTSDLFEAAGKNSKFDISKITSMETLCDFITVNAQHLGFVHKGLMQYLSVAEKYATSKTICWENDAFTKFANTFLDMQYDSTEKNCFDEQYHTTLDSCCIDELVSCIARKPYEEAMKKNTKNIFKEKYSFAFYFKPFNDNATLECFEPKKIEGLHRYCLINEKSRFKSVANQKPSTSKSTKTPIYDVKFTVENVIDIIFSIFNVAMNYSSNELTKEERLLLSNNTVTSKDALSSSDEIKKALNEIFRSIAINTESEIYQEKLKNYLGGD